MQKLLKLCSAVSAVALSAAIFAPSAEARLLYTNEDHNIDGDTFVIDFDDDAEGNIDLQFGTTDAGVIGWNSGSSEFEVSDNISILGNLTISSTSTLSGFWDGEMTEQMADLQSLNLSTLNGTTTSLSGLVYAIDKSLDDLEDAIQPTFADDFQTISGAGESLSGVVHALDEQIFNLQGGGPIAFSGDLIDDASVTSMTGAIVSLSGSITNIQNGTTDIAFNDTSSGIVAFNVDGTLSGTVAEIGKQVSVNETDIFNNQVEITALTGRVADLEAGIKPDFTDVTYEAISTGTYGTTLSGVIQAIDDQLAALDSGTSSVVGNINSQTGSIAQRAEFANAMFAVANDAEYAGFVGGETSNGTLSLEEESGDLAYVWTTASSSDQHIDIVVDQIIPDDFSGSTATLDVFLAGANNGTVDVRVDGGAFEGEATSDITDVDLTGLSAGQKIQLTFRLKANGATSYAHLFGFDIDYTAAYAKD